MMPKFKALKEGTNEALLKATQEKVAKYLADIFEPDEYTKVDDIYSASFGTVNVEIRVVPWHTEDVLVEVFSYVAEDVELNAETAKELLRLNAMHSFGSFGITFDNTVVFNYTLAGANLDFNELMAAVQTVATVADDYDEKLAEFKKMMS